MTQTFVNNLQHIIFSAAPSGLDYSGIRPETRGSPKPSARDHLGLFPGGTSGAFGWQEFRLLVH